MRAIVLFIGLLIYSVQLCGIEPFKPNKGLTDEYMAMVVAAKANSKVSFIYPVWGYYVDVSPGMSQISSNVADHWNLEGGLGYAFNAGYFRSLSPFIRISGGVGVSALQTNISLRNNEFEFQNVEDIDKHGYKEIISPKEIQETTNPMYASVPVMLELGNVNIDKLGFYINAGVRLSYLLSDGYSNNGSYSAEGRYDQYQVTLKGIEELGLYSNKKTEKNGSLKSINTALQGGAGVSIPLSSAMIFKAGVVTYFGISDISNPTTNINAKEANAPVEEWPEHPRYKYFSPNNSLTVNGNALTRHFGVEFGLYINKLLK